MRKLGNAPCECGYMIHDIPFDDSFGVEDLSGTDYPVVEHMWCPHCGLILELFHIPFPSFFLFTALQYRHLDELLQEAKEFFGSVDAKAPQ